MTTGTMITQASAPTVTEAVRAELGCIARTVRMVVARRLAMPSDQVGRIVDFADGSRSTVYRETVHNDARAESPVLLAVRFRLRALGGSRIGHALFRIESLLNTVLFAAHAGFVSKLWMTDRDTGFYRGIYEWDGSGRAEQYAEILRVVLRPWVQRGSFAYTIQLGQRDDFLAGRAAGNPAQTRSPWWLPVPPPLAAGHRLDTAEGDTGHRDQPVGSTLSGRARVVACALRQCAHRFMDERKAFGVEGAVDAAHPVEHARQVERAGVGALLGGALRPVGVGVLAPTCRGRR